MTFSTVQLSEDELRSGVILSALQKVVIQNRIYELSNEALAVMHTSADPTYFEKINFLKGQIAELKAMLANSDHFENQYSDKEQ